MVITESEFTVWNKLAALTLLGKRLKVWTEKVEVTNPQAEVYLTLLKQLREQEQAK